MIAFIFDFLVGVFADERDFDAAYAVVGLAVIPAALGNAAAPLPWVGWLVSLAASIYSLMLAYRFIPVFLNLPEASRVKHFVVSIVAALLVNILVSITLGFTFGPAIMSVHASDHRKPMRKNPSVASPNRNEPPVKRARM